MAKPPQKVEHFEFKPRRLNNPILRFIGGLKFGLTVLALLIIASSIGEFLPQGNPEKGEFRNVAFELVFRTWWYRTLLILQAVNLVINTYMTYIEETYPQFLPLFRPKADDYRALRIKHKVSFKESAAAAAEPLMQRLAAIFHARGYRTFFDGNSFYGHRGLMARFGSTVTHIGLITIIAGATAESIMKVEGEVRMIEGETVTEFLRSDLMQMPDEAENAKAKAVPTPNPWRPLGFSVHCDDFEFTEYPETGIASKYKSTVTFEGASPEPVHTYVRVNRKRHYGGWTFHQASYVPPNESSPDPLSKYLAQQNRYFIELEEKGEDGKLAQRKFETFIPPRGREVLPIPGHADRFFAIESDSTGKGAIWTVTSKEKVLARGARSVFGDLKIEMLEFYNDFAIEPGQGPVNKSAELKKAAALIEISAENRIIDYVWAFQQGTPEAESGLGGKKSMIEFVITNVDVTEPIAAAGAGAAVGKLDGAAVASSEAPTSSDTLAQRAVVTLALKGHETGAATGRPYSLRLGQSLPLAAEPDSGFEIPGPYELKVFQRIPAYATILSISKNPGIPIVWLGAILASLGPVMAFFISRRRIWGHMDWEKKQFWIGGESRYSREALEDEVAAAVNEWSRAEDVRLQPPAQLAVAAERDVLSKHL